MIKLPLERPKDVTRGTQFPWASCLPFVENSRGILIHRPRTVSTYQLMKKTHIGIGFWCGMHTTGGNNLTFLPTPPENSILCERCEQFAVANGLPSADKVAGRHVHKGRTKAFITCCTDPKGEQS